MTPLMSFFLRCLGTLLLVVLLWSLSDYSLAAGATPVPGAVHDVLEPWGTQAGHIAQLWNLFLLLCGIAFVAVVAAMLLALWKRPRGANGEAPDLSTVNRPEPVPARHVRHAVIASVAGLLVLILASVFTDRALARLSLGDAVDIELTAHQWWWDARYLNGGPAENFSTANEIHIPVGKPVVVKLQADDVIHSLWVPSLAGKKDLIPGRSSLMRLKADHPGIYRGQCAEFCGYQHALMGLLVIADPPPQYEAWLAAQKSLPSTPSQAQAAHGQQLFQSMSCAMCHTVRGTQAQAKRAPDLTHIASRQTLAAGTLANTPELLASWIADPQKHKPGTNMPATPMSREDLAAIVAYLGTLQ